MPRKNKYRHIYRVDNEREQGWRVVFNRVGCSVQKCFPDHGDRREAFGEALAFRNAFLKKATPPYYVIRPKANRGIFERLRGNKTVVTVHVPLALQSRFGDSVDYGFATPSERRIAWQEARRFRAALVREAENKFPQSRESKRWPQGL